MDERSYVVQRTGELVSSRGITYTIFVGDVVKETPAEVLIIRANSNIEIPIEGEFKQSDIIKLCAI